MASPQQQKSAPPTVEATAKADLWREGRRIAKGTVVTLARADYERDRGLWETEEDRRAAQQQQAAVDAPRKEEERGFWQRVKVLGETRERQEIAIAKAQEELAEQRQKLARQAREAAEAR